MRFWDSSAIAPLLWKEKESPKTRELMQGDDGIAVWWGTVVELQGALARKERQQEITRADADRAGDNLIVLRDAWHEISPTEEVRQYALRLLRVHPLRAGDALQLGAALAWASHYAFGEFVSYDERLRSAARAEGFSITPQ